MWEIGQETSPPVMEHSVSVLLSNELVAVGLWSHVFFSMMTSATSVDLDMLTHCSFQVAAHLKFDHLDFQQ